MVGRVLDKLNSASPPTLLHRNVEGGMTVMAFVCHNYPLSVLGRPGSGRRTRGDKGHCRQAKEFDQIFIDK
jgi:hypothetical protein